MFIDGLPHTLCIIHNLYSRIFLAKPKKFPTEILPLGRLVMQIVKLYARSLSKDLPKLKDWERQSGQCKNLLKVIAYVDGVAILKMLRHRRRCLNRALEGLGEHGMVEVETTPIGEEEIRSELMPMSAALKVELDRMISNCKKSMQKLHRTNRSLSEQEPEMSPVSPVGKMSSLFNSFDSTKSDRSATLDLPSQCNHQRLMQLTSSNIQDRLYKNKAVLNVIEPTLHYAQLPRLVSVLQERIEKDKDLLLTFSQLRKEIISVPLDAKLAPSMNHYAEAFGSVIEVLKEFVPDDPGTPETFSTSEFRSESGSNLSPTKSKESSQASPSHNGSMEFDVDVRKRVSAPDLSLENGTNSTRTTPKSAPGFEAVAHLRKECDKLRHELHRSQKTVDKLRQREKELVGRLSRQAQRSFDGGSGDSFEDISDGHNRPSELALNYRSLYSDGRLQALDALDASWSSGENDSVKSKLLFSVMVLSFRSACDTLDKIRIKLRGIMCASQVLKDPKKEFVVTEVENTFNVFLRKTTQSYDLSENVKGVLDQICQALYDRPGLSQSKEFQAYIKECVQLSWSIVVQVPALTLEYDATVFDGAKHDRFHTSDRASDQVVSYLWPSLLEKQSGRCVAKGIVVTGV
uniref:Mitochondria-eating protein n=1 Tax=Phallusia mammillata TaxID=59560 RepID=A0A6F9DGQ7_9ASCI|nr:uncharacterized protein LOC100176502 [Phallusia mammillata]